MHVPALMAAFLLPIIQARSPTYVPPPLVASCFADAHIFAAGPSELSQLIGWPTAVAVLVMILSLPVMIKIKTHRFKQQIPIVKKQHSH